MRALLLGLAAAVTLSTGAAAQTVCHPIEQVIEAMKANGFSLTFEGFLVDGAVLVFTDKEGEWFMVAKTDDGRGCALATGEAFNVTIGSLM